MRRLVLAAALLVAATACDYGPVEEQIYTGGDWSGYGPELTHGRLASSSFIDMEFEGMALQDEADVGVAGMAGMTCEYFTALGSTGTDVDVTDGTETVDDARPADGLYDPWGDTAVVLGHSDIGEVHEVGMPSGTIVQSWSVRGALAAGYVPEGVAVLRTEIEEGCFVDVLDEGRTAVAGHFCINAAAMLTTSTGLVLVDAEGAVEIIAGVATEMPITGALAALDLVNDRIVTATENQLVATDRAGVPAWTADLGGDIHGLARLGDQFLLSVKSDYRHSRLVIVDAAGAVVSDQSLERAPGRLYASPDGRKAALTSRGWSDTFTVAAEAPAEPQ